MGDALKEILEGAGLTLITNDELHLAEKAIQRCYYVGENSPEKITETIVKEIKDSRGNKALHEISIAKVSAVEKKAVRNLERMRRKGLI